MLTHLEPITTAEFQSWFEYLTVSYAADKVRAKQWGPDGAVERAQKDTEHLLSEGVDTPNHRLCHIVDSDSGERVGSLWWFISERFGRRVAFVFDIHIHETFRRRGYATVALQHLEELVRADQFEALSLHVFSFNEGAYKLYEKLGYAPTSVTMTKDLGGQKQGPHEY